MCDRREAHLRRDADHTLLRLSLIHISRAVENIFENSDFVYLLNQASGDRQILSKALNISPRDVYKRQDDLFTGMGYWTRANAEICILATKGHPKRVDAGVRQVILSHIEEHSKKPDEARERIVRLLSLIHI